MAVAATFVTGYKEANKKVRVLDLVFSSNYATGGESFLPTTTNVGMKKLEQVVIHGGRRHLHRCRYGDPRRLRLHELEVRVLRGVGGRYGAVGEDERGGVPDGLQDAA
jgi:hypothetical protein